MQQQLFLDKLFEFINTRSTKRYEEVAWYGFECVALVKLFFESIFALPKKKAWNANQIWYDTYQYIPRDWRRVSIDVVSEWKFPPQWSIIVLDDVADNNPYGHVWIVTMSNINWFSMLNQNRLWTSTWTGEDAIQIDRFPYTYVLWWYEPPFESTRYFTSYPILQRLVDDGIWNGKEWEWVTRRVALMLAKGIYKDT